MIPYILHTSLLIAAIWVFYKLLLEKETHYRWNRWILLGSMAVVIALPFVTLPQGWSLQIVPNEKNENADVYEDIPDLKAEDIQIMDMEIPDISGADLAFMDEGAEIEITEAELFEEIPLPAEEKALHPLISWFRHFSFGQWLFAIYLAGVAVLLARLLIQIVSLIRQIEYLPSKRDGKYTLVISMEGTESYSFFNYIFINPFQFDQETYQQVLSHEKIHADQKHSLDIMLAEFLVILQWFNPFAWTFRKTLRQNLEYLTDDEMVRTGADLQSYQMSLVQMAVPSVNYGIVANYSQSLLKKRILMMNTQKSSLFAGWKYLFLIPLLSLSVLLLNAEKSAEAMSLDQVPGTILEADQMPQILPQTELSETELTYPELDHPELGQPELIYPELQQPELDHPELSYPELQQAELDHSELSDPEDFERTESNRARAISSMISMTTMAQLTAEDIAGNWEAMAKDAELCLRLVRSLGENEWNWMHHDCYAYSAFEPRDVTSASQFKMTRKAGSIVFTGAFNQQKGEGKFVFEESQAYRNELSRKGVKDISSMLLFDLFFVKNEASYIDNLVELSKLNLKGETRRKLMHSRVKAELVKAYQDEGLSIDDNLNFIYSHVKPETLKKYQAAGLDLEENKNFVYSHVNPELLKSYKEAGLDLETNKNFIYSHVKPETLKKYEAAGLDLEENKNFVYSHVSPELLKSYKEAGLDLEANKNFIHSHIKPETLKKYEAAGLDLEENKNFVYSHVSPELLKSYKAAGLDLEANKNFIHSHVKPETLQKYQAAGLDLEENKNFVYSHVNPELLKSYKAAGLDLEANKNFIHSHVKPETLKKYTDAGLDLEENKNFVYSHVSPELLKSYKTAGLDLEANKNFIYSHINPETLKKYKEMGLDLEEHKNLIYSHASPEALKAYLDAGYDLKKYEKFIHMHIRADFLKKYEDAGLDLEEHMEFILKRVDPEKIKEYLQQKEKN